MRGQVERRERVRRRSRRRAGSPARRWRGRSTPGAAIVEISARRAQVVGPDLRAGRDVEPLAGAPPGAVASIRRGSTTAARTRHAELARRADVVLAPQDDPERPSRTWPGAGGSTRRCRGRARSASPGGTRWRSGRGRPRRSASGTARRSRNVRSVRRRRPRGRRGATGRAGRAGRRARGAARRSGPARIGPLARGGRGTSRRRRALGASSGATRSASWPRAAAARRTSRPVRPADAPAAPARPGRSWRSDAA